MHDITHPTLSLVPPWWHSEPPSEAVLSLVTRVTNVLTDSGVPMRHDVVPHDVAGIEAELTDTLLSHELARVHGQFLQDHPTQVSDNLMGWVQRGHRISATAYAAARQSQDEITQLMHKWLRPGEVALLPATVDVAPRRGHGSGSRSPQRLWTLTGMPALTLPIGHHEGFPLGLQLVGRRGENQALLRFATDIEACLSLASVQ